MFDAIIASPMFGVALSFLFFEVGIAIQNKTKSMVANPLVICAAMVIAVLKIFDISYEEYNNGARFISMFLAPCTALLAVNIYRSLDTIKRYLLPILLTHKLRKNSTLYLTYVFSIAPVFFREKPFILKSFQT